MKSGLSKREKILVFIACAAVIIFVMVNYALVPLRDELTWTRGELERLTAQRAQTELIIQAESEIREENEKAVLEMAAVAEKYPADLSSYEIDWLLTALCQNSGLTPISLRIAEPRLYAPSADGLGEPAFSVVSANMVLSGDYNALKVLMDTTKGIDRIRITRLSFANANEVTGNISSNITVAFEITMLASR